MNPTNNFTMKSIFVILGIIIVIIILVIGIGAISVCSKNYINCMPSVGKVSVWKEIQCSIAKFLCPNKIVR